MDKKNEHIKAWAEKLNELEVPGAADAWQDMRVLLDAEMPVQPKRDRRRWVLLILLLLLLIGVCHFPKGGQPDTRAIRPGDTARSENGKVTSSKDQSGHAPINTNVRQANPTQEKDIPSGEGQRIQKEKNKTGDANKTLSVEKQTASSNTEKTAVSAKTAASIENKIAPRQAFDDQSKTSSRKNKIKSKKGTQPQTEPASAAGSIPQPEADSPKDNTSQITDSAVGISPTAKSEDSVKSFKANGSGTKPGAKKTSTRTTTAAKKDSVEDARGWAFGLGLNQFFAVGNQEKSNFNADGTSGTIADYIPVPVARFYFHKWFYLQAEAQFNSPQYTKTLLAGQGIKSAGFAGTPAVQSIFIKKLFYFNIPLSVHYSPLNNLFIGAGLQYSRLTNGVALFQDTRLSGGYIQNVVNQHDSTLIVSKLGNFKHDSAYQSLKTNEWRFLVDLNYQWKRATIGVRYNQAFSDFIHVQISYANITQAQNRSLQIYLRYMLLDLRKKSLIPKK